MCAGNAEERKVMIMTYIDGFVVPVPKDKIGAYQKMAADAGKIWMEHGALQYKECMADERMQCDTMPEMPFDCKRMAYGGFEALVDL